MSRQDTIAISVENQLRELHGKIWLALNFLEAGDFRVILGEEQQLKHNIYEIAPDFLLLNSVRWPEKIRKVSEAGCLVASLNEEGNIFEREEEYFQRVDSVDLYEFVDLLFVPGQAHANIIRERAPSREDDVVVTGNPRFDLLQPELRDIYRRESEQLTDAYGRYALVNTNFVWANRINKSIVHAQMKNEPFDIGAICDISNAEDDLTPDNIRYNIILVKKFIDMIGMMAEMDILDTVIVRPHPSKEDHNFYEAHFSSSDSIVVETSGDVRPWILGSHVVIHNSCTSGVEAALMNQPVIAYKPKIDVGILNRKSLPNNVSEAVDTKSELNSIINAISSDTHQELKSNDQRSQLCERFANFENLAASQIVKVVSEQIGAANYPQSIQLRHKLSRITRSHMASYIPKLSNKHTFSSSQKYPGTTQSEIYDFITKVKDERMVPDVRVQNLSGFKEIYLLERDT